VYVILRLCAALAYVILRLCAALAYAILNLYTALVYVILGLCTALVYTHLQVPLAAMRVDGGVSRSEPLLQFQADILNVPVKRPHNIETTALGAGLCAGVGAGVWNPDEMTDETVSAADVCSRLLASVANVTNAVNASIGA
jgi:glycerol kinase